MSIKSNPLWLKMDAIRELCRGKSFVYEEHNDKFTWGTNYDRILLEDLTKLIDEDDDIFLLENLTNKPSDEEIETKRQELINNFAMKLLREERDRRLAEVDWWTLRASDGVAMTQEQKDYRKALRDLPSNTTPDVDDRLKLINVTWPTKPE